MTDRHLRWPRIRKLNCSFSPLAGAPRVGKIKPYLSKICDQNKKSIHFMEIDYDAAPVLVEKYAVESLPTMILLDSSGMPLMRINESSEEALKALSSEIRRLAETKSTREEDHVEPKDFPSPH